MYRQFSLLPFLQLQEPASQYLVTTLHPTSCSRYSYKLYPIESSICTKWSKVIFRLHNEDGANATVATTEGIAAP